MNKAYDKVTWQNTPSTASPLNATNLNKMSDALDTIDDRVIALDTNKANTSDVTTALAGKVDKETGKGLSANDYTNDDKTKLAGISAEANKVEITPVVTEGTTLATISIDGVDTDIKGSDIEVDSAPSSTSTNPLENKAVYELVQSILPEKTATGNPISIDDASGLDAKSALVTFAPKQSGTGDPSPTNIRPISGWDALVLHQAKKNLINIADATYTQTEKLCDLDASFVGKTVCISAMVSDCSGTDPKARIRLQYDLNGETTYIARDLVSSGLSYGTTTIPQGATNISIYGQKSSSTTSYKLSNVQLEFGSAPTEYEPYQGSTHTATFDTPIPGGSYDFVSGEGQVIYGIYVFDGSEAFSAQSGNRVFTNVIADILIPETTTEVVVSCSHFLGVSIDDSSGTGKIWKNQGNYAITFRDSTYGVDAMTFKNFLTAQYNANTPVVLAYKLATPTPISLPPADVNLIKGLNTVWTDGDTVQVKYSVSIESLIPNETRNLTKSSPITEPQTKETETEITEETEEK